ncbi:leucine-rich repeat domain-containing protein [Akkermansiaceae bacterium]|nr:leucine-rich repeat domain-containing protein [Akkermansiaceae bacterium]
MKYLITLLAFIFLIGCNGEKSNVAPPDGPIEEAATEEVATETNPIEAVSVNPNFKYKIEGDEVTITGTSKRPSNHLIIPKIIEGKPVTSIGESAFVFHSRLKSITIPDGVTSIGDKAFNGRRLLTSITIPDSVTSIGDGAFKTCIYLTGITIPNGVTRIGNEAFRNCESLKSITIPDDVTSIGDEAFYNCQSLTSMTIGNSVTSIGEKAFFLCRRLTSITIPDSVTNIGDDAATLPVYGPLRVRGLISLDKRLRPDVNMLPE